MEFLRFACADLDWRTGQPTGLFSAAYAALRSDSLDAWDADALRGHVDWVERHLPIPARFSRTRNVSHKQTHGLSWLKPSASTAITRFYAIADILARNGHDVGVNRSERPGYIVYEDDHQVVAEPFHGERRR